MKSNFGTFKIDEQECYCDVCEKDMVDPETGTIMAGIKLTTGPINSFTSKEVLSKQLGPYWIPGQDHAEFNICWECWLKSLGVKPKENNEQSK